MGEAQKHDGPMFQLSQQAHKDSQRWFPATADDLGHLSLALCGEVGEVANIVKKLQRGDKSLKDAQTRFHLMMEIADVQTYLLCIAGLLGLDLDKAVQHVRSENEKRFGQNGK
jgi:NTP pyrophosphatase (non-canonical NTP hydrolase)